MSRHKKEHIKTDCRHCGKTLYRGYSKKCPHCFEDPKIEHGKKCACEGKK